MSRRRDHDVGLPPPDRYMVIVDDRYRGYLRPVPRLNGADFLWFFEPLRSARGAPDGWIPESRITRWLGGPPTQLH